jgi:hypothetical protein
MSATSSVTQVSWEHFYRIVLSTAKMLDNSRPKSFNQQRQTNSSEQQKSYQGRGRGRGGGRGRSQGRSDRGNGGRYHSNRSFTLYTGPNMVMDGKMFFSEDDWNNKLTQAQKSKLIALKKAKPYHTNCYHAPTSTYNMHSAHTNAIHLHLIQLHQILQTQEIVSVIYFQMHHLAQQTPSPSCISLINMNPQPHVEH